MDKNSNTFVMLFSVVMCVVLAILLAGTFQTLKGKIAENVVFDQMRTVLTATGLVANDPEQRTATRAEMEELYRKYIRGEVLLVKRDTVPTRVKEAGEVKTVPVEQVVDLIPTEHSVEELTQLRLLEQRKPEAERREFTEFFTRVDDDGNPVAYAIPIEGLGLWGMIHGYLALNTDLDEVVGITFYQHKETPGLGGDIDRPSWQDQWPGKKIRDEEGHLVGVRVKKGKVDPSSAYERNYMVDGLSGATITSNGVTNMVIEDLREYQPYFAKLKEGR